MADWVLAIERAYVAAATGGVHAKLDDAREAAAAGAIASRYLAVGTPRSFGLIGDERIDELSLIAHRTWFAPIDIRVAGADAPYGRRVTIAEALACDIVCIHAPLSLAASQLRRGTHVNALAPVELDDDVSRIAAISRRADLGALAAGLVDGRQLDEITIFIY